MTSLVPSTLEIGVRDRTGDCTLLRIIVLLLQVPTYPYKPTVKLIEESLCLKSSVGPSLFDRPFYLFSGLLLVT